METGERVWSLGELAIALGAELEGDPAAAVRRAAPAGDPDPEGLTFALDARYLALVDGAPAAGVLCPADSPSGRVARLRVQDPRVAFGRFLHLLDRPLPLEPGVHASAVVHPMATVHPEASVGAYAVIERGASVGVGARVFAHAYVGEGCEVGEGATLYPHAVLYRDVSVGPRAVVHAHAVLGADGFGFTWNGERQIKVPQVGRVEIGADVEIGAGTTVDRATAGATRIEEGVKLDNLVQIAHNVSVGAHSVVASLTGLSGSTRVGRRATIAGQCATSDHVAIGDGVTLGGRTGVTHDLPGPGVYLGFPARPYAEGARVLAAQGRVPDLLKRVRELEKRLEELEKR